MSDALKSMIANMPEKTGKSLEDWVVIAREFMKASNTEKHGEIMKHLKGAHGMTHGFANLVTLTAREAIETPADDLIGAQYAGAKAELKPIYDAVIAYVNTLGQDVEIAPKKSYVSLRRNKQFGLIQPSNKTRVDLGINLKGTGPSGRLEASGSFNAMVSHRVRLSDKGDVDADVKAWLKSAYEGA